MVQIHLALLVVEIHDVYLCEWVAHESVGMSCVGGGACKGKGMYENPINLIVNDINNRQRKGH